MIVLFNNRVFRKLTKLEILASEALIRKKISGGIMLSPVGIEPRQPLILKYYVETFKDCIRMALIFADFKIDLSKIKCIVMWVII